MRHAAILIALGLWGISAAAHPPLPANANEARTARRLDRIADSPPRLRIFLAAMPKGGDLHNHAGGAVFAEDYLRWAAAGGLCLTTAPYRIVAPPCGASERIAANGLEHDYRHYSGAVDGFSTRGFEAGVDHHLTKPANFEKLKQILASVSHKA